MKGTLEGYTIYSWARHSYFTTKEGKQNARQLLLQQSQQKPKRDRIRFKRYLETSLLQAFKLEAEGNTDRGIKTVQDLIRRWLKEIQIDIAFKISEIKEYGELFYLSLRRENLSVENTCGVSAGKFSKIHYDLNSLKTRRVGEDKDYFLRFYWLQRYFSPAPSIKTRNKMNALDLGLPLLFGKTHFPFFFFSYANTLLPAPLAWANTSHYDSGFL